MNTLLLRLSGPMQSWGVQSHFEIRDTALEPSKSGVIGLVCASLGRPRQAAIDDLANLRFGVRVDVEGKMERDYHTALDVLKAGGGRKDCEPSSRYYLAGARFLAGLAGEDVILLEEIQRALRNPVWPQYLGRKAFAPSEPVWLPDGLQRGSDLGIALASYPWLGAGDAVPATARLVLEDPGGSEVRPDQPLSFAERRFAPRRVRTTFVSILRQPDEEEPCTSHA